MIRTKMCGMTNEKDALKAASLGAWAVGFIFTKKSPRFIGPYKARKIISRLPPFVTPVGVFVNQKEGAIKEILNFCGIDTIQLHGDETPAFCQRFKKCKVIKAIRVDEKITMPKLKEFNVDAFLFDAYDDKVNGGTGKTFDWSLIKGVKSLGVPVILSGGLHYNNVQQAIEEVRPFAVDTCSGIEDSPGQKNHRSMDEFIKTVNL